VSEITDLLDLGSSESERSEIPKNEMVVGSTGLELVVRTVGEDGSSESSSVGDDLSSVSLELGGSNLLEGDGDGGDGLRGGREGRKRSARRIDSKIELETWEREFE